MSHDDSAPPPSQPPIPTPPPEPYPAFPREQYPQGSGKPPSSTMAVWALVLAIIPAGITWIVGAVLAIVVLVRVGKNEARGKGLAIAALVIVGLWTVFVVVRVVDAVQDDKRRDDARNTGTGEIGVLSARVGDCLGTLPSTDVNTTLDLIPCAEPHRAEVYALFDVKAGEDPDQTEIDRLAEGGCASRFDGYIGTSYARSKLDVMYLPPLASSPVQDDGVICLVVDGQEPTVGSLKNANR